MRVVQVKSKPVTKVKRRRFRRFVWLGLAVLMIVSTYTYFRPLPNAKLTLSLPAVADPVSPAITWPSAGDATISAVGYDFVLSNTAAKPVSTASMAKVITVLCVLEKHPLNVGDSGPSLTMTADDVERLQQQYDQGGSYLAITEGEVLTQYQMIQAVMLPSANNIADSLAIWAFGSLEKYRAYAQNFVAKNNMLHTQIGPDASGLDPSTTSTTADLTTLGKLALKNPVVMQIAGTEQATFATAGTIKNTNTLLADGVLTGLKTGANSANSGGFIFTATASGTEQPITLVGAVVNAGSSANAVAAADRLARSASENFETINFLKKGSQIGIVETSWGAKTSLVAADDVSVVRWKAHQLWLVNDLRQVDGTAAGKIGTITLRTNGSKSSTPVLVVTPIQKPSVLWRITHVR